MPDHIAELLQLLQQPTSRKQSDAWLAELKNVVAMRWPNAYFDQFGDRHVTSWSEGEECASYLKGVLFSPFPDEVHADIIRLLMVDGVVVKCANIASMSLSAATVKKLARPFSKIVGLIDEQVWILPHFLKAKALTALMEVCAASTNSRFVFSDTRTSALEDAVMCRSEPEADRRELFATVRRHWGETPLDYRIIEWCLTSVINNLQPPSAEFIRGILSDWAAARGIHNPREVALAAGKWFFWKYTGCTNLHRIAPFVDTTWPLFWRYEGKNAGVGELHVDYDMVADWDVHQQKHGLVANGYLLTRATERYWRIACGWRIMAMLVAVSDGVMQVRHRVRFFRIAAMLPMDLQSVLTARIVGLPREHVKFSVVPDFALRWALGIWRPPVVTFFDCEKRMN